MATNGSAGHLDASSIPNADSLLTHLVWSAKVCRKCGMFIPHLNSHLAEPELPSILQLM